MPRAGRELEELVAALEAATSELPVRVTSPDSIVGRRSGASREVDVTLRGMVGSLDLLVIFECRDRNTTQDVTWIEQLASKGKDVGANKIVAVSSSGYSAAAKRLAESESIELRTMTTVTDGDTASWVQLSHIDVIQTSIAVIDTEIDYFSDTPAIDSSGRRADSLTSVDDVMFTFWPSRKSTTHGELRDLAIQLVGQDNWDNVSGEGLVHMSGPESPNLAIVTIDGPFPLARLSMRMEVSSEQHILPFQRVSTYGRPDLEALQAVEFAGDVGGSHVTVSLVRNGDEVVAIVRGIEDGTSSLSIEGTTFEP
ncbi:hypothetical protein GCM10022234_02530 [Aeromicrobium panaciterrae]|uniref:restriction endonuclease n=1 Tax=Aeromicrobium panaciterrae TaxID=363861 RepID=UPI0031DCA138